jgi:hypothetical protein
MKRLNISVNYPHSTLDITCAVESVVSKLPQALGMELRWKIMSMLEKSKSCRLNMTTKKLKALRCLRLKKYILGFFRWSREIAQWYLLHPDTRWS